MKKIRTAVIGTGTMGRNHVRVFSELERSELVAICDTRRQIVDELSSKYKVAGYIEYKKMIEEQDVDALSIAVPSTLHREIATYSAEAGIHILVEKPVTGTFEDALKLKESVERSRIKFMVGHVERFNPAVTKVKRLIGKKTIGELMSLSTRRIGPRYSAYTLRRRDVGVIVDLAVHDIDVMRYLLESEVETVQAKIRSRQGVYEDDAYITLEFENGAVGTLLVSCLSPVKVRVLNIVGSESYVEVDYLRQDAFIYRKPEIGNTPSFDEITRGYRNSEREALNIQKQEPLKIEVDHFLRSIIEDKEPSANIWEGIQNLKVALAAQRSAEIGQSIRLSE